MFKDTEEALRRLEAELLREEEEEQTPDGDYEEDDYEEDGYEEEEYDEEDYDEDGGEEALPEEDPARQTMPRWMQSRVNAYNADTLDTDLDTYSRKVYRAGSAGRWIAAAALIVLAAVLLVLAFFMARNGG